MNRLSKVNIKWSADFTYAIGLLTADGNLSPDGRHINMTSKDKEIIINFKKCLKLSNKVGRKSRGREKEKKYFVLQFGDKNFYEFLLKLGLKPNKSKTLSYINIPHIYFRDFLRGYFDGDGSVGAHKHPESKYLQLRIRLASASIDFLSWLKVEIYRKFDIEGGWIVNNKSAYQLSYGKKDSIKILNLMYVDRTSYLKRKYLVSKPYLKFKK